MKILIVGHNANSIRIATNVVTNLPHDTQIAFLTEYDHDFRFATYYSNIKDAKNFNADIVFVTDETKEDFKGKVYYSPIIDIPEHPDPEVPLNDLYIKRILEICNDTTI